ncbi:hypothetical protein F3Y22_tig00110833pilonHSYRG00287 [Hibiscus syriacus]|uniref:Uncharacterized protein n=1 Tax=Hibiscus syriacus TaxID=106335 RepID=A0A6A2ZKI0_HIBSY|nr:uncharacterized protein LOC120143079 [Hibiscus syriacus]KAE8692554.1 hypothetical protein F3Y22_tig00110833pilonHSYRG00287 [Hibiscus syriacus]
MSITLPMKLLLPSTTPTGFPYSYCSSFFSSANPNFSFSSSSHHLCTFRRNPHFLSKKKWPCGHSRTEQEGDGYRYDEENVVCLYGSDEDTWTQIPTQAQSLVEGSGAVMVSEMKPAPDVDYLQELLAIQQQGPRAIGFFGTRNMGFMHQEFIEILSYALVITKNHIYTSGASGTNAAVIRGALRAEKPELLTVILPQSLKKQPPESQELLEKVKTVIEKPYNDHLPLLEASRLCNRDIISHVQQVICFAFHDSKLLMETCQEAKNLRKIVTLFYLD